MDRPAIAFVHREPAPAWLAGLRQKWPAILRTLRPAGLFQMESAAPPALVIVGDPGGGTWAAIEIVRQVRAISPRVPILFLAPESSEAVAIAALKCGVSDYLKEPADPIQVREAVSRLMGRSASEPTVSAPRRLVGDAPSIRAAFAYASRLAQTNSTVLITGETGTGKDLAAELIHSMSQRHSRPFVALNCAAIPDSLLESELFGRERGAYTGADTAYEGKLKLAEGGTVFFDEIGDLTPYGQAKLLRVLECRQAQRLGSAKDIQLDIRILAATNQDLGVMVEKGLFRRDLYFRLNVTRLALPSLRSHREDIPLLLSYFASAFAAESGRAFPGFSSQALSSLSAFDWPGNVRQLRNLVEELFVNLPDAPIGLGDLPQEISVGAPALPEPPDEKMLIVSALTSTRWNKKRAAQSLNWSRMTLYRKMARHHIPANELPDSIAKTVSA